jgi:hypothetical protein
MQEFDHPNDENKVKCAARALDKMGIAINKQEVIDYCNELGMPQESIEKIVDWYCRPKNLRLKIRNDFFDQRLKGYMVKKDRISDASRTIHKNTHRWLPHRNKTKVFV